MSAGGNDGGHRDRENRDPDGGGDAGTCECIHLVPDLSNPSARIDISPNSIRINDLGLETMSKTARKFLANETFL
jgi:hypothetical protein